MTNFFRWFSTYLRVFLLAFALALAVWVMAVTASDPDETNSLPQPKTIEFIGQDSALILTGETAETAVITLRAPRSVWEQMLAEPDSVRAIVDLSGLESGTHKLDVVVQVDARPVRIISVSPATLEVTLEILATRTLPVTLVVSGETAVGYQAGEAIIDPATVTVSGPDSLVARVETVRAALTLNNNREGVDINLGLIGYDHDGSPVSGVTLLPESIHVSMPVTQMGGYRDLAVKVVTVGRPDSGYRPASVAAFPAIVTVYSANALLIEALPGYVETVPLDLSGARDNIEKRLNLVLPADVTLVGEKNVLVQVGIVPIQGSLTVAYRPVTVEGLGTGLKAQVSPVTVDVILSGPIPALESLYASDITVSVDLTGRGIGTYQLTPVVTISSEDVVAESILPATVQVIITRSTP